MTFSTTHLLGVLFPLQFFQIQFAPKLSLLLENISNGFVCFYIYIFVVEMIISIIAIYF